MKLKPAAFSFLVFLSGAVSADQEIANGVLWTYSVSGGKAAVSGGRIAGDGFTEDLSGIVDMPSMLGGVPVSVIERHAFANCAGLTSISLPDALVVIGDYAFWNCTGLSSVSIPDSVETIGDYAFEGCASLPQAPMPRSLKSIGAFAFRNCGSVTGLATPDSLETIGERAFENCGSLESAVFGRSVTNVSDMAFYNCTNLVSADFTGKIEYIGRRAFYGCPMTNCLAMRTSVPAAYWTWDGDHPFYCSLPKTLVWPGEFRIPSYLGMSQNNLGASGNDCSVEHVIVTDGSKTITTNFFGPSLRHATVSIPSSVTNICEEAFVWCELSSITIPDSVVDIGPYAFRASPNLSSVTLSRNVKSIQAGAFFFCPSLTEIVLPDSLTDLGGAVFSYCTGLVSATLPIHLAAIPPLTFENCTSLTNVAIPETVASIGHYAFSGCAGLTEIAIPDNVTNIDVCAFSSCPGLREISLGAGVEEIGDDAFRECTGLAEISLGDKVKNIGAFAFSGCSGLTSATIQGGVTNIGGYAFEYCSGLPEITIPDSVTVIGECAFFQCSGLTNVLLGNGLKYIELSAFRGCSGLTEITIPDSVINVDSRAFKGCSNLTSAVISTNASIGREAFADCIRLESVTIPNGVDNIYARAFEGCSNLTKVTIPSTIYSIGTDAFSGCSSLRTLFFPARLKNWDLDRLGISEECRTVYYSDDPLTIVETALPAGRSGKSYAASLSATGGAEWTFWSATGLPAGLSMSTGGRISGTPRASGTFSVAVTLEDAMGNAASRTFALSVEEAPPVLPKPVYRFYSPKAKAHFYTMNEKEMLGLKNKTTSQNWNYNGIAYYAYDVQVAGTVPLYRFYSPKYGGHLYTVSESERTSLMDNPNWNWNGIAYYVYPRAQSGASPVWRFWSPTSKHHFFTMNETEMLGLKNKTTSRNWDYQFVAFYALSRPAQTVAGPPAAATRSMTLSAAGGTAGGDTAATPAPWTLLAMPDAVPAADGDGILGLTLETAADAPDAAELSAGPAPLDEPAPFRLTLPAGAFDALLWSAADGVLGEGADEGAFDFELPDAGVWHWLRVRDAAGADAFSLWLRLAPAD